jgi:hypothetical protein
MSAGIVKCATEQEAIAVSLKMNQENPAALWLYAYDSKLGWFLENWRELTNEGK